MNDPTDRTLELPFGDKLRVSRGAGTDLLAWVDYISEQGELVTSFALDHETIDRLIPVLFKARDELRALEEGITAGGGRQPDLFQAPDEHGPCGLAAVYS